MLWFRSETVQTASGALKPFDYSERGGVLRLPGRRQPGGQAARARGDHPAREQELPGPLPRRPVPVPRPLLLQRREGGDIQALRQRTQTDNRQHVRQVFQVRMPGIDSCFGSRFFCFWFDLAWKRVD